jgi:hypothetical protein
MVKLAAGKQRCACWYFGECLQDFWIGFYCAWLTAQLVKLAAGEQCCCTCSQFGICLQDACGLHVLYMVDLHSL